MFSAVYLFLFICLLSVSSITQNVNYRLQINFMGGSRALKVFLGGGGGDLDHHADSPNSVVGRYGGNGLLFPRRSVFSECSC